MARLRYNNLIEYLAGPIDSLVTSFGISAPLREGGVNIPTVASPNVLAMTIDQEVIYVTAYTSGSTTITSCLRGQENTAAAAHSVASAIYNTLTKVDIEEVADTVAVVIVAASDAPTAWLARADFVCDGINDEVQLIAARDALPTIGGIIQLSPGEFSIGARVGDLFSKHGTTLRGIRSRTDVKIDYNVPTSAINDSVNAVFTVTGQGALIEDLSIWVNNGLPIVDWILIFSLNDVIVQHCYLDAWDGTALHSFNSAEPNIVIIDSEIWGRTAISVTRQDGLVAMRNNINCYADGFGIRMRPVAGAGYGTYNGSQARIIGNRFFGTGIHVSAEVGAGLSTMGGAVITGNHFQFPKQAAVKLDASDENIVANNRIIGGNAGSTEYGIWLVGGANNTVITGNEIHQIGKHGIFVDGSNDNIIHNNEIVAASQLTASIYSGILLTNSDANSLQGNQVRKGTFTNKPLYGIRLDTSTCDNNLVRDNDLRDASNTVGNEFSDLGTATRGWELVEVDERVGTLTAPSNGVRRRRLGRDCVLGKTLVDVNTAPTGASVLIDVNKNGTTIFTTQANRPTVAVSTFAATSATPDVKSGLAADYLTVDVDQVGSTVAGADLVVLQQVMPL